jgi:hypothetical protein
MEGEQDKAQTEGRAINESETNFNPISGQDQPQPTILDAALAHAGAGRPIFPCGPDKKPLTPHGFKDATTDPATITRWFTRYPTALIGMPTGLPSKTLVIDVDNDPATGKDGDASLSTLEQKHGKLPPTVETQTPRRGRHLIFRHPGREYHVVTNAGVLGPDLDVRGDGGYVILPPSRLPDGRCYQWEGSSDPDEGVKAAEPPSWLVALVTRPQREQGPAKGAPVTEGASLIPEGQRNDMLFRLARSLRAKGLTEAGIAAALEAENAARCVPPLPTGEVRRIAESGASVAPGLSAKYTARKTIQEPPEWHLVLPPYYDSAPNPTDVPEGERFALITPEELCTRVPGEYFIKHVLPAQGVAVVYGPPKSGKTFLVLDMIAAVVEGRSWFGHRTRSCPVVYVGLEGEGGLSQRWRAYKTVCGGQQQAAALRFITDSVSLMSATDIEALAAAIQAGGCAGGIVVIDTLNAASPGADENSSVDMGRIVAGAKMLQRLLGGLVFLVHHAGKDQTRGLRGHSSLSGAVDVILEVTRDVDDRRFWRVERAKDGPENGKTPFGLAVVAYSAESGHRFRREKGH